MAKTNNDEKCRETTQNRGVYEATEIEIIGFDSVDIITGSDDLPWNPQG